MRYRKGTGRTPLDGEPTKDSSIAQDAMGLSGWA